MIKPTYKMAVFGTIFKYSWAMKENEALENGLMEDDKLIKSFAKQQDEFCDPEDIWYIQAWFKRNDDPINDNKGHIFPSSIPFCYVNGKRTGDIIEFSLGVDPDTKEELLVRVECDQSIMPGFNPNRWVDEDPAYNCDPFVAEWFNAAFRRLEYPYKIDYNQVEKERDERNKRTSEYLNKLFGGSK